MSRRLTWADVMTDTWMLGTAFQSNWSNQMSADLSGALQEALRVVHEFSVRYPASTVVSRIDVNPWMYAKLRKAACDPVLPRQIDPLFGIRLNVDHGLPPGCDVRWYADGHFEVTPGFCEVQE